VIVRLIGFSSAKTIAAPANQSATALAASATGDRFAVHFIRFVTKRLIAIAYGEMISRVTGREQGH
jgi:hypothetical protein